MKSLLHVFSANVLYLILRHFFKTLKHESPSSTSESSQSWIETSGPELRQKYWFTAKIETGQTSGLDFSPECKAKALSSFAIHRSKDGIREWKGIPTVDLIKKISMIVVVNLITIGTFAEPSIEEWQNAYQREREAAAAAEERESEAAKARDEMDQRRKELEQQINAYKGNVEKLKMREDKASREMEVIRADLEKTKVELINADLQFQKQQEFSSSEIQRLEQTRNDLNVRQKELDARYSQIREEKKRAEKSILDHTTMIENAKRDIAKMQTNITKANRERAELESEEMRARADWMQAKLDIARKTQDMQGSMQLLSDARKQHEQAMKDLNDTKNQLAKVTKQNLDFQKQSQAEIARYEREIAEAGRSRISAEANMVKIEAETAKLTNLAAHLRDRRDQAAEQVSATQAAMIKSSISLEKAKSEFTGANETMEQRAHNAKRDEARIRGLAAAESAERMIAGGKSWVSVSDCKSFAGPTEKSIYVGDFKSGTKLVARLAKGGWIEVMNSDGPAVYIPGKCGKFEE